MPPLPIDALLPEVVAALRRAPSLVVEAPPGAGKTTRVPRALLESGLSGAGQVLVLEPRRLAARLAARRVAEELGEPVGETVGYQVRFEDVSGPRTRLRFLTEALLTRRLLRSPRLEGVGAVVLDEWHERHLHGDLALALLRRLQRGPRPDLRLVAMSATLDAAAVAGYLGAPVLRSEGRAFPVELEHLSAEEAARAQQGVRLEQQVASAVRKLASAGALPGHVLVFLPGAAEIRRCRETLEPLAAAWKAPVMALHGDLPPEEQDRAVARGGPPRIILSTNVAESSVTIDGVAAVVDSGLARLASHSPWSGLPRLELARVSRASAAQRAGRAGRTGPGRCLRLYTRHDHDTRPAYQTPEIARQDLCETLLLLARLEATDLEWLEPPPAPAAAAARALLRRLGALAEDGEITALGGRLVELPLHPRLGRLLVEAERRGAGEEGALLAALLGERDIRERWDRDRRAAPPTGPSDLLELAGLFEEARRARFAPERLRGMGLHAGAAQRVERARKQIGAMVQMAAAGSAASAPAAREEALLVATLAAYPDRVARRRAAGSDEVLLAGGGAARLAPESVVREAALLVAVDAEERRAERGRPGGAVVRLASQVTQEQLLDLFPGALRYQEAVEWNEGAERVDAIERLLYQDLVLEEGRAPRLDAEQAAALLAERALARGARSFAAEGGLDGLLARTTFASRFAPSDAALPPLGESDVAEALRSLCTGRRSFSELREARLAEALLARWPPDGRGLLETLAPERLTLPGGRGVRVHYPAGDESPWIESRLQDFFGLTQGPAVAGGRVPLVLHLLAPSQRPVQVTTDLAGFWDRHYPALRRELMRRYPRHAWPENPRTAKPPTPKRNR